MSGKTPSNAVRGDAHDLFRQEVIQARRGEWLGTIDLAMPVPYRILAFLSLVVALLVVGFSVFGRYTHHEQVAGKLVPSLGLLATTTPSAGTVTRVLVHEGDAVEKDQPLIEISSERDSVSVGKTHAAISDELKAQRIRVDQTIRDQGLLLQQKQEALKTGIESPRRQLGQIDAEIKIQDERIESAQSLWQKYKSISERGVVSGVQVEQQRLAALSAQAESSALKRQRAEIEQRIDVLEEQLRELPLNANSERAQQQQKLADIDQALAQNEGQRAIVLRAAAAGLISNVMVKDGESVNAGTRLLALVPRGSDLQAELWLPSRAIGFVAPGDPVVLRYRAFPYQKFGQQRGAVSEVSSSASSPAELGAVPGNGGSESLYRVVVALDKQSIPIHGKQQSLKPGMALDADILLDSRRLIEWAFDLR